MATRIQMHPRPMHRHTSGFVPATAEVSACLPGLSYRPFPGVYIRVRLEDGKFQDIGIPVSELHDLEVAIKAIRSLGEDE